MKKRRRITIEEIAALKHEKEKAPVRTPILGSFAVYGSPLQQSVDFFAQAMFRDDRRIALWPDPFPTRFMYSNTQSQEQK